MTVLEDFEDGINSYGGDTGDYSTTTSTVFEGDQSATGSANKNDGSIISDTDRSTGQGTEYVAVTRTDNLDWHSGFVVGTQAESDTPDGYVCYINWGGPKLQIGRDNPVGDGTNLASNSNINVSADVWFKLALDWQTDGTLALTATRLDNDNSWSVSATDTTYTSGGIGWYYRDGNDNATYFFDEYVDNNLQATRPTASGATRQGAINDVVTTVARPTVTASGRTGSIVGQGVPTATRPTVTGAGRTGDIVGQGSVVGTRPTVTGSARQGAINDVLTTVSRPTVTGATRFAFRGEGTWRVDGDGIPDVVEETRQPDELALTVRARDHVLTRLESYKPGSGKFDVLVDADGRFRAIDRSSAGITRTLTPPEGRQTLRATTDYLLEEYSERATNQDGTRGEVTLTWVPDQSRTPDGNEVSQSRASGEFAFAFYSGTVATDRVRADPVQGAADDVDEYDVTLHLSQDQAKVVETSATYHNAVAVRSVPDGANLVEDHNPDGRNTVSVSGPSGGDRILPDGDYAVEQWETEWRTDSLFVVRLTLLAL